MNGKSGLGGIGRAAVVACCLALAAGFVPAGPARAEDAPKDLTCTFSSGASQTFEAGVFKSQPSHPLTFRIEAIDLDKQTATIKATRDAQGGKLSVVRAINANHFLEAVNEGFLNLTTVYDKDATSGKHPAVHSRHFGLLGSPVFGQYTGFCSED